MSNRKALAALATEFIATEFRDQKSRMNAGGRRTTVRTIADATGLGTSTVQRALSGASDIPVEAYIAMCHALDLSPAGLIARAEAVATNAQRHLITVADADPADLAGPTTTRQRSRGSR